MNTLRIVISFDGGNDVEEMYVFNSTYMHSQSLEPPFKSVDSMPVSVQEKLAVLLCQSCDPPTADLPEIGTRIDETTFWLYITDDELQKIIEELNSGNDTRKES